MVTGCDSIIRNDSPRQIPQNASEIYTLTMKIEPQGPNIIFDSYSARIVIDGEIHKMKKRGALEYTYDYKRPTEKHRANYYYEVDYKAKIGRSVRDKFERSKLYDLIITNRYVIGFESNRGIPGAAVVLLGRGFKPGDFVDLGGTRCETTFVSHNSLSFTVPMMKQSGKYHARLVSDNGDIGLGDFFVDQMALHTNLSSMDLASGEKQILVVTIDSEAPDGGILVDVTTNIPESVIMKDIFIPAEARSASVVVQAGAAGSGMLYLTANGFEELKIPLEVVSAGTHRGGGSENDGKNGDEWEDEDEDFDEEL
jgi:hypothetical protein